MGDVYAPDVYVEFGFGSGPLDASPVWTDSGGVWREISSRRGRGSEFDQFTPGSMTVVLKDEDRTFDPLNTAGPYYGQLVPNVPIRVYATHSSIDYPVFYGYVDGWDYQLSGANNVGWVTVNATDGFKILAQKRLATGVYESVVLADTPVGYWPLGGTEGAGVADESGSGYHGRYYGTALVRGVSGLRPFGTGITLDGDPATHVVFPAVPRLDTLLGSTWSIEFWCQNPDGGILWQAPGISVSVDLVDGFLTFRYGGTTNYNTINTATFDPDDPDATILRDKRVHHVVIRADGGAPSVVIDGTERMLWTDSGPALSGSEQFTISYPNGSPQVTYQGTIQDLAIYDYALTDAQVVDHYDQGRTPWFGDFTGARAGRVLDEVGWPAGLRSIDEGEVQLGNADIAGTTALDYLRLVAATEQGRFFMGADGAVTVHGAQALTTDTTPAVVFSDDGADVGYLSRSFRMSTDDRNIYNEALVQRKYGVAQTVSDATSVAAYGPRTRNLIGLLMATDTQARGLAGRIVYRYKDPQTRVESFTVNPQADPTNWPAVLARELGDHVQLEVQPVNTGAQETIDLDLEQIVTTITPSTFEFTFIGSARDPNIGSYLTLGGDGATQGVGTGVLR